MIISYALQQFLFCGSEVHDRDRGAVCPGIAIAAGMLFVTELMALMMDAQKDLPVDMGGVSRTWDFMIGRYGGVNGSAREDALLLYRK